MSLGTSGETGSEHADPIQFPQVNQPPRKDPFMISVSGVIENGSPLLAFNVPSIQVACISTSTALAKGPTGNIAGTSGSSTISSPVK